MPDKTYTPEEAIADAKAKHPDCEHGEVRNGMNWRFDLTHVVALWRNDECYLNDEPPKYQVEGYLQA